MKRIVILFLSLSLLLAVIFPAAADIISDDQKYHGYITQLGEFLTDSPDARSLDEIYTNFDSLGRYEQSEAFAQYIDILRYLEPERYSTYRVIRYGEMLKLDTAFCKWLEENSDTYGTIDMVIAYSEGRMAENRGDTDAAIAAYEQCIGYYDTFERLMAQDEKMLEDTYNQAVIEYNRYTPAGNKKALELLRTIEKYGYMDTAKMILELESRATPTPRPTPSPTPTPTLAPTPSPVPQLTSVMPSNFSTQYNRGVKGQCCDPGDVMKLLDGNKNSSYYWLIWTSTYTDSTPEFTFTFLNDVVTGFGIRNGNLKSKNAYTQHARPKTIMLTITSGGRQYYESIAIPDKYSEDYYEHTFSRIYYDVTKIDVWYQEGYKGKGDTTNYCYITDLKFIGYQ